MNHFEFDQGMDRLKQVFGKAANYTDERAKLIFNATNMLPANQFNQIVDHFIATARYAPLPKDFVDASWAKRRQSGYSEPAVERPPVPIKCRYCNDGGVAEVEDVSTAKEYFIRCGCAEGAASFNHELPRWDKSVHSPQLKMHEMFGARALKWKPKRFDPANPDGSMADLVALWNFKMRVSHIYWADH